MRTNWRLAALPLALTVLSAALVFATQVAVGGDGRSGSSGTGASSRDATTQGSRFDGAPAGEARLGGLMGLLAPVAPERVYASSLDGFLDDLRGRQEKAALSGSLPCVSVEFEGRASLPEFAGDVLKAYARTPSVSLVTSGYLDLKGNAWGAVLRGGTAWCDVLLVTTEDDTLSRVQVTRVLPEL